MAVVTKTLKTSGGDYSSQVTWESTEQTNLVTDGDSHILEVGTSGSFESFTGNFTISGWTTSATNNITIRAVAGAEHNGVPQGGSGQGSRFYSTNNVCDMSAVDIVIEDMEMETNGATVTGIRHLSGSGKEAYIERCIVGRSGTNGGEYSILFSSSGVGSVRNCLVIDHSTSAKSDGIYYEAVGTGVCENNTVNVNNDYGVKTSNTNVTAKNVVSLGNTTNDWSGTFNASSTNNASGDSTAKGSSPVTGVVLTDGTDFTEPSTGDYSPVASGALDGAGDNSVGGNDIAGVAHNDPPEIGCYALAAAGGLSIPQIIAMTRKPNTPLITM